MKSSYYQKLEPSQLKQTELIHFDAHMKVTSTHVMVGANYSALAASLQAVPEWCLTIRFVEHQQRKHRLPSRSKICGIRFLVVVSEAALYGLEK